MITKKDALKLDLGNLDISMRIILPMKKIKYGLTNHIVRFYEK